MGKRTRDVRRAPHFAPGWSLLSMLWPWLWLLAVATWPCWTSTSPPVWSSYAQVIRHKLVDMFAAIESTAALLASVIRDVEAGEPPVPTICILKNQAVDCMKFVSDEGLQILGTCTSFTWSLAPCDAQLTPTVVLWVPACACGCGCVGVHRRVGVHARRPL